MNALDDLTDFVTLVYHEARNVRHLIRAGAMQQADWKYLSALPTNRNEAWTALQDVRRAAQAEVSVQDVLKHFQKRFHVALPQLEELHAHAAWRNSRGNAWLGITKLVRQLADSLEHGLDAEAAEARRCLQVARHNTGVVAEKLRCLDAGLLLGRAGRQPTGAGAPAVSCHHVGAARGPFVALGAANRSAEVISAKSPDACSAAELKDFAALVLAGGEVTAAGLEARIKKAEALVFLVQGGCLSGIAAVKNPEKDHRERVFKGAQATVDASRFPFELGWVFVLPSSRGAGLSHRLVEEALSATGGQGVFATSSADNAPMHKALEAHGFRPHGKAYVSGRRKRQLVLFVRNVTKQGTPATSELGH